MRIIFFVSVSFRFFYFFFFVVAVVVGYSSAFPVAQGFFFLFISDRRDHLSGFAVYDCFKLRMPLLFVSNNNYAKCVCALGVETELQYILKIRRVKVKELYF